MACIVSITLLSACADPDTSEIHQLIDEAHHHSFFAGSDIVMDVNRKTLLSKWHALKPISVLTGPPLTEGWQFGEGNPANGLQATASQRPAYSEVVSLPHRVLKPDWPLWYERDVGATDDNWIYVRADDGAQVFQNGRRLEPVRGEYFELANANTSMLTIRVLNNALRGGLRDVRLIEASNVETYQIAQKRRNQMARIMIDVFGQEALKADQMAALESLFDDANTRDVLASEWGESISIPQLPIPWQNTNMKGEAFSFTAWGDSQGGWEVFQQLIDQMVAVPAAFSIGLGDLVGYGAQEEQWLAYTAALQPLLAVSPVFSVPGNHDYDGYYNDLIPDLYREYTALDASSPTYFSWVHDGAFFLAMDPNRSFPLAFDQEQRDWALEKMASEEWREANWRFLLMHQAPYAQGWPGYHGDAFIKDFVDSLAEAKSIDFVLTGHNHDYERLTKTYGRQDTHFFIFGGAGGGLEPEESSAYPEMDKIIKEHHFAQFDVQASQVEVTIWGLAGEVLDRVLIRHHTNSPD